MNETIEKKLKEIDEVAVRAGFEDSVEEKRKIWLEFFRTALEEVAAQARGEIIKKIIEIKVNALQDGWDDCIAVILREI